MIRVVFLLLLFAMESAVFAQFTSENGPWYAARVRDIAVGYKNGLSVIYAVNMTGGTCTMRTLVKSTDGGETWQHIQAIQNPYSVATQRNNPDVVLVCALGTGIVKSTDGGTSWSVVFPGFVARRIAFQRTDPNIVWAGAFFPHNGFSLYVGAHAGDQWQPEVGFTNQTSVTSIVFHPTDPGPIYVSGVLRVDPTAKGIWKRVQGGWQKISLGLANEQIAAIAIHDSNPSILYAGTMSERGESNPGEFTSQAYESQPPRIYKTTDGGTTWSVQSAFNAHGIAIDPTNSQRIVAGNDEGMFRSTDNGVSWSPSNMGLYDKNILTLVSDTSRGGAVLAGTFHSLYKTTNAGLTWIEQTNGIEKGPTTDVSIHSGRMLSCAGQTYCYQLTDTWLGTIHRRASSNSAWLTTFANSGFDPDFYYWTTIRAHILVPQTVFAAGSFELGNETATVFRSTDDGFTWQVIFQFGSGNAVFKSIDFDATDPSVVFVAGRWNFIPTTAVVARSTNTGSSWTTMSPGMTDASDIVLDPTKTGANRIIYVAGSGVRKSTNDGATWIDANTGIGNASTLAIDPISTDVLFGGNANGVYRTVNAVS